MSGPVIWARSVFWKNELFITKAPDSFMRYVSIWRHERAMSGHMLLRRVASVLFVFLMCSGGLFAYSVLTHEQIVDFLWSSEIRPLLLQRFPGLSEDQLREAHAYAYGGAVIQDLGYYPFGSRDFSNLVHYVRSGDFVSELLRQSQDVNEYAFALGALSHYAADIVGHPAVKSGRRYPISKAESEVWQVSPVCAGQDGSLENRVWFRHAAGCEESVRVAAIPRLHRISGLKGPAGARFPNRLRSGIERCPHP